MNTLDEFLIKVKDAFIGAFDGLVEAGSTASKALNDYLNSPCKSDIRKVKFNDGFGINVLFKKGEGNLVDIHDPVNNLMLKTTKSDIEKFLLDSAEAFGESSNTREVGLSCTEYISNLPIFTLQVTFNEAHEPEVISLINRGDVIQENFIDKFTFMTLTISLIHLI